MLKNLLLIGFGSAFGGILRYSISLLTSKYIQSKFPLPTFLANIIGCLLIGIFIGWIQKNPSQHDAIKFLLIVGFCGGFTTFSSFSLENINLIMTGQIKTALIYIFTSIIFGLLSVWAGISLFQQYFK